MTIERARQILGSELVSLSDQEVTDLIYSTGQFADTLLDIIVDNVRNKKEVDKKNRKVNNKDIN